MGSLGLIKLQATAQMPYRSTIGSSVPALQGLQLNDVAIFGLDIMHVNFRLFSTNGLPQGLHSVASNCGHLKIQSF